jgi:hypothetical protein
MKIKISDKLINIDDEGFVHQIDGNKMIPTIIVDLEGNLLAGERWCWDVIEKQQGRQISYMVVDTKIKAPKSAKFN